NIARIERSAQTQAKSGTENAGWYEKWWEKYDAKGWTEREQISMINGLKLNLEQNGETSGRQSKTPESVSPSSEHFQSALNDLILEVSFHLKLESIP
ncbi:hypothetical protein A2U01_0022908, partial [Trifolium medium]|nr:hypothetical protein [Trifolium medium]